MPTGEHRADNLVSLDAYRAAYAPRTPPDPARLVRDAMDVIATLARSPDLMVAWTEQGRRLGAATR